MDTYPYIKVSAYGPVSLYKSFGLWTCVPIILGNLIDNYVIKQRIDLDLTIP